ncbi:shikimate dehydrogenase [Flavobacterium sp. CBA20B-1]|uniref:shikimate dehydrogenase family protein n=1 Tax=unclassified Flavobacterium TaxID=196869 RepID=UPI0022240D5B|nr:MULTISPECIES: shikimate dehydrogenase [unclassified Flavobacterium]WCM42635.1 shikimate dehydrogenase [Flavobacterium sp. CBA20B-1]
MKTYGLIGKNISYSFSRNYFNNKFNKESILNTQYINFDIDNLSELNLLFKDKYQGFNVTIPYKEAIIPYLDELDIHAEKIGAVNTIKIENEKKIGYNTDWIGFKKSIATLLEVHHTKALILGTGGASKAVIYALEQLQIETLLVSRSGKTTYNDLSEDIIQNHKIIINCTPLGTFPNTETAPKIPYKLLTNNHLAYDLVYNPAETLFLKNCKKQGATIKNGWEMLQIQAEEAWKIWNS